MKRSREEFEHGLNIIWSSAGQISYFNYLYADSKLDQHFIDNFYDRGWSIHYIYGIIKPNKIAGLFEHKTHPKQEKKINPTEETASRFKKIIHKNISLMISKIEEEILELYFI